MAQHGRHIEVCGVVQGVGFRPWVFQLAMRDHVSGRVWNHSTGVAIDAFGDDQALERFTSDLRSDAPRAAGVRDVSWRMIPFSEAAGFTIAQSAEALGIAKSLINEAANVERLDYHLDRELENLTRIANGADFAEGLAAFFEKRPPRFNTNKRIDQTKEPLLPGRQR
jgi:acylphosphatase